MRQTIKNAVAALLVLAVFAPCIAAHQWDCPVGPNLVRNPGFEEVEDGRPSDWWAPEGYGSDEDVVRGGNRSLEFVNRDPERYLLCSQGIDLEPGGMYEVRAYVKTAGIAGDDSGATVCVEWQGAGGKWMGGHYPEGRRDDAVGWHEVRGVFQVPDNAAGAAISCYLRKGMTGTAWWDDVSVRRWRQRPMDVLLISPNYRGWIVEDSQDSVAARVDVAQMEIDEGTAHLVMRLVSASDEATVAERVVGAPTDSTTDVRLPVPDLDLGPYWLKTRLVSTATGETMDETVHRLERKAGPRPACYIDEHNRVVVDGEPFFPLGMYWAGVDEEQLRVYTEGPFNCLMPYGSPDREQMDLIEEAGLKVIHSIKDFYYGTRWCPDFIRAEADEEGAVRRRVREFRDHPALLAWYLNDERPLSMLPRLEVHQRWVEEEDPNHPTWIVLYQVGDVRRYARTFDVIGTDPYPIPDHPPAMAGQWASMTREAVADARAIWMVPQVFRWPEKERPPTLDEMRSMAWQCIAEGADGLIFYSWFDLRGDKRFPFDRRWEEVKQVAREIHDMIPVLLAVDPLPEMAVSAPEAVHWTARSHEGSVYLLLVNDSREPVSVGVRFPGRLRRVRLDGANVALGGDGVLTIELEPLGVKICRVET
jgi:hypothetical protein